MSKTALEGQPSSSVVAKPRSESIRSNPPECMSREEAAIYLGVSIRWLARAIATKRLRVARLGRRVIIRLAELRRLVELAEAVAA
ncbi:helix-turn-helix domain-containing protein [Opitutaceae bacterium TSB47]|uniref:helix-turn-helix domain-containing protein n=2 Tax=Termitidicoccus mucosus TaxID=1184151 RepID=UPI0009FFBCA5